MDLPTFPPTKQKKIRLIKQLITISEDEQLKIIGFKKDGVKVIFLWIFYILTFGFLALFFYWYPRWKLFFTHKKCHLDEAEEVLLIDIFQKVFKTYNVEILKNVKDKSDKIKFYLGTGLEKECDSIKAFWHKKDCYIWNEEEEKFNSLHGYDDGIKHSDYFNFKGFSVKEQNLRRTIYKKNEIEIPSQSAVSLALQEMLTPFYIFQIFSLIIWFADAYYYYTIAIFIMSFVSVTFSVIESKKNQVTLRKKIHSAEKVLVLRDNGRVEEINSDLLVPGDVIAIPEHTCTLHCDAVLLNGNCVVNESMLTGESVPVTKTPIPKDQKVYNVKEDSLHTLFSGTKIIQTRSRSRIFAVVLRTGFQTCKGQLVRTILHPPPSDFKFDQDSYKFIGVLTFIAFVGFIYTIVSKSYRGIPSKDIATKALDIITIVIPPALPAALTVGKLYALFRLKKGGIFCTNFGDINVSGSLNCICFDKTGTLTEDDLDMHGVIISEDGRLHDLIKDMRTALTNERLIKGMVSCHSLTLIDGEIHGDPLDVKMFEASGWTLYEKDQPQNNSDYHYSDLYPVVARPPHSLNRRVSSVSLSSCKNYNPDIPKEIEIISQHHFSSSLQRMSVLTKEKGVQGYVAYCKGAPEKIISLCRAETVPRDALDLLNKYAQQGFRVIAFGWKKIDEIQGERENVESNLEFLGYVVFENKLKLETKNVIKTLKDATLKVIMITGDNILTALSVARECGIINKDEKVINVEVVHLKATDDYKLIYKCTGGLQRDVLVENSSRENVDVEMGIFKEHPYCYVTTGNTWLLLRRFFPDVLSSIVDKGVVFARMTSEQKQQLVQELKTKGFYVGMCGDGANDVGALKTAHVGVSLSDEESSVASSFTSRETNISCAVKIIREGRAALVTSLGVFKFVVCYSLAEFTSVIILYSVDSNLTSMQFLFIDIVLALQFEAFFGKTNAYKGTLSKSPPKSSLLGTIPLTSIILQIILIALFQIITFSAIQDFAWFVPFKYDTIKPHTFDCYENYAVFCTSMFQYIVLAIVFSKGRPYREPLYTNVAFMISLIVSTIVCCYITLNPSDVFKGELELRLPPSYDGRVLVLVIALIHFLTAVVAEHFVVEVLIAKKILRSSKKKIC